MSVVTVHGDFLHQPTATVAIERQIFRQFEPLQERRDLVRRQLLSAELIRREQQNLKVVDLLIPVRKLLVDFARRASSRGHIQSNDVLPCESVELDGGAVHCFCGEIVEPHAHE